MNEIEDTIQFLNKIQNLKEDTIKTLSEKLFIKKCKKKERILNFNFTAMTVYFVVKGIGITFVEGKNSEKIVSRFASEKSLFLAPISFYSQKNSLEAMELIEDSTLVGLTFEDLQYILNNHIEFNIVARKLVEHYFLLTESRAFWLRKHNLEEKWKWFEENYKDVLKRGVPQEYIATFIGVDRLTLNRFLNHNHSVK